MGIGELAKTIGVSDRILRRLAKMGLIPAKRLATGKQAHWRFSSGDVDAIRQTLIDGGVIEEPAKQKNKSRSA